MKRVLQEQARCFRRNPTQAEERLWEELRKKKMKGLRFRRQHVVGRFVVDFYCARYKLAVELDGCVHQDQRDRDHERQRFLEEKGLRVLRLSDELVLQNVQQALFRIRQTIKTIQAEKNS